MRKYAGIELLERSEEMEKKRTQQEAVQEKVKAR